VKLSSEIKPVMAQYGYKKSGDSFWKNENGFYKLINFQKGAYGSYFFINVGLHPIGLPMLCSRRLCVPERPRESECLLRQRAEGISPKAGLLEKEIGFLEENGSFRECFPLVLPELEAWLTKWGDRQTLLSAGFDEICKLFSTVPILWKKEFWLVKSYCALMAGDKPSARGYFLSYQAENPNMDFSPVDHYMDELIASDPR